MFESYLKPPISFPTLTGSIVTFNSQYAGLPLKSHTVDIDSVGGVSAINITATGKNFLRNTYAGGTPYGLSITTNADGSITINGTPTSNFNGQIIGYFTLPAGTYIYTDARPENSYCYTYLLIEGSTTWYTDGMSFTVDGNTRTRIILYFNSGNYYDFTLYPMIRPSSIADSTFEPFGTYTTITIGSTVNEATYNARTGVMKVTQPTVQTIQLPPCPIDVLAGVNNIWADTGDTTLQYPKFG